MPARQFLAASLEAAYDRRTRAMGWTAIRDSDAEFYLNGATPQQVRRAVVRWAAENGRPDPCARRTEVGRTRFARLSARPRTDAGPCSPASRRRARGAARVCSALPGRAAGAAVRATGASGARECALFAVARSERQRCRAQCDRSDTRTQTPHVRRSVMLEH